MEFHSIDGLKTNYRVRRETLDGREHLVAPVVLMTEGVHAGSGGPMYYPAEELSRFAMAWNGVPVPNHHPTDAEGMPLSANLPQTLEQWNIGRVFNVGWEEDNARLRGEVWVDVARARAVAPEVLSYLNSGRPLEVSTGLFSEDELTTGTWNGETYQAIARHIRPDHLAVLPGGRGACSYEDGCGVRANQHKTEEFMANETEKSLDHVRNGLAGKNDAGLMKFFKQAFGLTDNATNFLQLARQMQRALDRMDGPTGVYYLEALFDNSLIYRVEKDGATMLYSTGYNITEAGEVVFTGEAQQVREERDYVPVTANEGQEEPAGEGGSRTPTDENINANGKQTDTEEDEGMSQNRKDMIAALRANGVAKWPETTEENERLEAMSCPDFAKEIEVQFKANAAPAAPAAPSTNEGDEPDTVEAYVEKAPEELKTVLNSALKVHSERKTELVEKIKAHSANKFSEDQLKAKDVSELENIAVFVEVPAQPQDATPPYRGGQAGGALSVHAEDEEESEGLAAPTLNDYMPQKK